MKKKHILTILALILVLLLSACSAATEQIVTSEAVKTESAAGITMDCVVEESVEMEFSADSALTVEEPQAQETGEADDPVAEFTEKIIYTGHVYVETTDFDGSIAALNAAVTRYGGFIQDSNISGHSNGDRTAVVDRYAYYVIRIPAEHFDTFMSCTGDIGNVTSSGRNAQNVTSQYTDYEARLSSLRTQEERLLTMLGTAGDLESLIALEQRLSEVRYEIESIERELRNLDQRLAYSTVNIDLQEVEIYTQTAPVQRSFGEKLTDSLSDGWQDFLTGCENLLLGVAQSLPVLLLLLVVLLAVVIILVKLIKKWIPKMMRKIDENHDETSETK